MLILRETAGPGARPPPLHRPRGSPGARPGPVPLGPCAPGVEAAGARVSPETRPRPVPQRRVCFGGAGREGGTEVRGLRSVSCPEVREGRGRGAAPHGETRSEKGPPTHRVTECPP